MPAGQSAKRAPRRSGARVSLGAFLRNQRSPTNNALALTHVLTNAVALPPSPDLDPRPEPWTPERLPRIPASQEQLHPPHVAVLSGPATASGCERELARLHREAAVARHSFVLDVANAHADLHGFLATTTGDARLDVPVAVDVRDALEWDLGDVGAIDLPGECIGLTDGDC